MDKMSRAQGSRNIYIYIGAMVHVLCCFGTNKKASGWSAKYGLVLGKVGIKFHPVVAFFLTNETKMTDTTVIRFYCWLRKSCGESMNHQLRGRGLQHPPGGVF